MTLIECIPNFSEGRRLDVVDKLAAAAASVHGVSVLDQQSDATHNRCVITFVGDEVAIAEAAFRSIRAASELIDLNSHQGAHPRFGAADVVPFVPLRAEEMPLCVEVARGLAKRVAAEIGVPAFLYEDAALVPEHRDLASSARAVSRSFATSSPPIPRAGRTKARRACTPRPGSSPSARAPR